MKRSLLSSWLGIGVLGLVTVAGCRHAEKSCDCCCCCSCGETVQSVVVVPEATKSIETAALTPAPAPAPAPAPKPAPAPAPDDSQLQRASHKLEPPSEVLATVVTPESGSIGGGIAGTICLTAAEAEGMGIRPGHTPDALYAPGSGPANPVLHLTGAQDGESGGHDVVPAAEK